MVLAAAVEAIFSLCAGSLVNASLVVEPMSLLLLLPFEPCFKATVFNMLYVDSDFISSEVSCGLEELAPRPLGV